MALRATYGASPRALRGALADGGLPWESRGIGGGAPAGLASLSPTILLDEHGLALSGDLVSAQADQSGNGWGFAQGTSTQQPYGAGIYGRKIGTRDALAYVGTQYEVASAAKLSDILGASNYVLAVVDIDAAIAATLATYYAGNCIFGDATNNAKLCVYTSGGVIKAAYGMNGTNAVETTITTGPHLIEVRKTGTTLGIAIDGGSEVTGSAAAAYADATKLMRVGWSNEASTSKFACGTIAAWQVEPSAAVKAQARAMMSAKYGILATRTNVFIGGDSIAFGYDQALAGVSKGGYRARLGGICASGNLLRMCGPSVDNGRHRGVTGEKASDVVTGIVAYAAQLAAAPADIVVLAWGYNDLGTGALTAAVLASMDTIHDATLTALPSAKIIWTMPYLPGSASSYFANTAEFTTYRAAVVAHALGKGAVACVDMGQPVLGADGNHPLGDATGYGTMTPAMLAALLANG